MAQGPNDFLDKKPDELESEIAETRSSLTDKLETLECRVRGTVEAAQESVEHTIDSVKQAFDIRHHVDKRPWTVLGLSVATGFVLGSVRKAPAAVTQPIAPTHNGHGNGEHSLSSLAGAATGDGHRRRRQSPQRPTLKTRLIHQFEDEIALLEKTAIGGVMGTIRDWLKQAMPSIAPQLDQVMNSATSKLGGEPVPSSVRESVPYGSRH